MNKKDDFVVLENDNGELMLSIPARDGEPSAPNILITEERNAVLYRSKNEAVPLEGIHPDVIKNFISSKEVLVGEVTENETFSNVYTARVLKVDKLPK